MTVLSKGQRQALTEFRETEILDAARKVFGEKGFADATVDMIAAEAGVAKGTLYLYYESKEAIFWTALVSRFREMLERTRRAVECEKGTEAKIRAALRVRFECFRSDEQFVRMYVTEFGHICRTQQGAAHELYVEGAQFLAGILKAGVDAGEVRPLPPMQTAVALMDLVKSTFITRYSGLPGLQADVDGAEFVFALFWNGVRPEKEGQAHA